MRRVFYPLTVKVTLFAFAILLMLAGCATAKPAPANAVSDDLAVYRAALSYYGYQRPVINEHASYRGLSDAAEIVQFLGNQAAKETAEHFIQVSKQPVVLSQVFAGEKGVAILSAKESDEIFTNHPSEGWDEFHRRYANNDPVIVSLSPIGYNAAHTEAIVEVGKTAGFKAGAGDYLVLKKEAGEWKVVTKKEMWKS